MLSTSPSNITQKKKKNNYKDTEKFEKFFVIN